MITKKELEIKKSQIVFSCNEFLNNEKTRFHSQILSIIFGHLDVAFEFLTQYLQENMFKLEKHVFYEIIPGLLKVQITPSFHFYFSAVNRIPTELEEKYFILPAERGSWVSIWQLGKSIIKYCDKYGYDMSIRKRIVNVVNEILKLYDVLREDFDNFIKFLKL